MRVAHRPRTPRNSASTRAFSPRSSAARHEHAAKPSTLRPFDPLEHPSIRATAGSSPVRRATLDLSFIRVALQVALPGTATHAASGAAFAIAFYFRTVNDCEFVFYLTAVAGLHSGFRVTLVINILKRYLWKVRTSCCTGIDSAVVA